MKRQFFKHGLIYSAANLLSGMGSILLVPILTHGLVPETYGVVDYFLVLQNLVQICAGLEITQAIARFFAAATDDRTRQDYASTGFVFLISSLGVICLGLWIIGWWTGGWLFGLSGHSGILGLAIASIYIRILFYALQGQLRWEFRSGVYSITSLVAVTSTIVASAYFLLVANMGLTGVFLASLMGYSTASILCIVALQRTYKLRFAVDKLLVMLRFSLPLAASALALYAASYGDRILVASQLGFYDLGLYGIAARFASVVTLAIAGFQLGAAPLIYRHFNEPSAPSTLAQLMRIFMVVGTSVVVGLSAFSIEALAWLTPPEYSAAWRLIPILSLNILISSLYIFVPGLTVRNLTGRFALVNIMAAALTLGFVICLLRLFGMPGIALGALLGATCGFLLHAATSQAVYPIPIDWQRFARALAISLLAILICQVIGSPKIDSLAMRTLVFVVSIAGLFMAGLTPVDRSLALRFFVRH